VQCKANAAVQRLYALTSIGTLNRSAPISMSSLHVMGDVMQIRSKTYLQFISRWRSLRGLIPPHDSSAPAEASPFLIYIAVVLAVFLAILEIDRHRGELETLGLLANGYPMEAVFMGP
jgi:hypothetical protein